jgi:hypothetical protein
MKKFSFVIVASIFCAIFYLGTASQPVSASSKKGILTDTTKKEKKKVKKPNSDKEASTDTSKAKK